MQTSVLRGGRHMLQVLIVTLLLSGAPHVCHGEEAALHVHQSTGEVTGYAVAEVIRVTFVENQWMALTDVQGTELYTLPTIGKITFRWGRSSVEDWAETQSPIAGHHLLQNQPNPFSSDTIIAFDLPRASFARIRIYSADGRLICTLVEEPRPAGANSIQWDGRDSEGRQLASGVYFYSLTALGVNESRKVIILP